MPPKTRTNKASKVSKENACVLKTNKVHKSSKGVKPPRRALADKTNSASDDNASVLITDKPSLKDVSTKEIQEKNILDAVRPRRARCLPKRYNESQLLKNLTNSDNSQSNFDSLEVKKASAVKKTQNTIKKIPIVVVSPFKTPIKTHDNSLLKARPKRISKLPSKFDDHSISPNKFIPVQPINASTPLANKTKNINKEHPKKTLSAKNKPSPVKDSNETGLKQKTLNDFFNEKTADTNNNAKRRRQRPQNSPTKSPTKTKEKQISPKVKRNASVRVLGDNKKSLKRISSNLDVYEFTYDPQEEPPPTKKKKKRTVAKKASKPKVNIKSNYDKNLAKALATLKSTVSSKTTEQSSQKVISDKNKHVNNKNNVTNSEPNTSVNIDKSTVNERNFNSIRVEDIAKDMQVEDDINIDYSPVNSPCRPQTPAEANDNQTANRPNVDDPLNLRDDLSFFDEQPAASSSMNVSQRHPHASPWRVEFGNLPIKWQVNTYVKPNMTPAVESSFINFNDTADKQKKHVYTNMVSDQNESIQSLPPVVETTPSLKQTSIISFIKEVVEKKNKKRKPKLTPVKANSLFEDVSITSVAEPSQKKLPLSNKNTAVINLTPIKDTSLSKSNNSSNTSNVADNSVTEQENALTPKVQKEKDGNLTYFGFDEIEDQENISPKKKNKIKSLRSRTRGILQELNVQKGPTRVIIPVNKTKPAQSSDAVNKLFDGVKSATEPPVFPEVAVSCNTEVPESTNISEPAQPQIIENDDSESVHLFEDIEFVHQHKHCRKSYGKSKKVAFSKTTALDNSSDSSNDVDHASSDEDLDDLSFKLPTEKPKKTIKRKKTNKQKLSKKEEKEVEAWAAGFNSMCEDIDEFDLVVE